MDFWQLADSWSTVWEFESRPLLRPLVERCLRAAHAAPASPGIPPWRFTVLMDPAALAQLSTALAAAAGPAGGALVSACRQAPLVVAVSSLSTGDGDAQGASRLRVAACLQNLLLCAWDEGVGSVTLEGARWDTPGVRAACQMGAAEEFCALVGLGFPASVPPRHPRPPLAQVTRWR